MYTLLQVGDQLVRMAADGTGTTLTLPAGVTLSTALRPHFTPFNNYLVVANSPSRPLLVNPEGVVYELTPDAPVAAVTLSDGASGTLSGTYLALQTYQVRDPVTDVLITESDYGPAMTSPHTIASKKLHAAFAVSPEAFVTNSQIWRTTNNGAVYFPWTRTTDNTATSIENDNSDSSLGILERPIRGPAPHLSLVATWRDRVWGVAHEDRDTLRYTEADTAFAWGALNSIKIDVRGEDAAGVTALIPRRNYLGIARYNRFAAIAGTSTADFTQVALSEHIGCVSQDTVCVFRDTAYFLWLDGVYTWSDSGFSCVSNAGNVRAWFATGQYFNRNAFGAAFAVIDQDRQRYRLYLAGPGSTIANRWVELDLTTGRWFGPHSTTAFQPTSAFEMFGPSKRYVPAVGSYSGFVSIPSLFKSDWGLPISALMQGKRHTANAPDQFKHFGTLALHTEEIPGRLQVRLYTDFDINGGFKNERLAYVDQQRGRSRVSRVGSGKTASVQISNNELNRDVVVYGYTIDPVNLVGRR